MARKQNRRQTEVVEVEVEEKSGLGIEDGIQIFTFLLLIGAVVLIQLQLLPRYTG